MNIYNSSKNNLIAREVIVAETFISRSLGLIPRKSMREDEALVIRPCCSIHTFFMKLEIDVLFVNSKNQIVALYENVKENRVLPVHLTSSYVIELAAGQISAKNIEKYDTINLE